jgi:hypothetical protein
MSEKIPQRNVNLAEKYNQLARLLLLCNSELLKGEVNEERLRSMSDSLLDGITSTREFIRKVTPIELKGQRV